jgi:hypothetical protein
MIIDHRNKHKIGRILELLRQEFRWTELQYERAREVVMRFNMESESCQ